MTTPEFEVPIDPRRAQQSRYTNGDQDTGLIPPEHRDPVEPTDHQRTVGLRAIQAIRSGVNVEQVLSDLPQENKVTIVDLNEPEVDIQKERLDTPRAWKPTVPFEPLKREIGISPDADTKTVPLTLQRQEKIYQWQLKAKKPYDLIQRAEGRANTNDTYWGAGVRSGKNIVGSPAEVAAAKSSMGRAAIHGLYSKTHDHKVTAEKRLSGAQRARQVINWRGEGMPTSEDLDQLTDSLQELGNNIAANMDDIFPGGNEQARIAGNSVIALSEKIRKGEIVDLKDYTVLIQAAVSNNLNQVALWKKKMRDIEDFSREMGIVLSSVAA